MRILFVSSANPKNGLPKIIVKHQGQSLTLYDNQVEYYTIKGKGIFGYLRSILPLNIYIKKNSFDIFHAHYSYSGFVAALAGAKPLIVSLMGSDLKQKKYTRYIIRMFQKWLWDKIIVKTDEMKSLVHSAKVEVIPNGVDFNLFRPIDRTIALDSLKWNPKKKHILFPADPGRYEKNYILAEQAIGFIDRYNIEVHFLKNVEFTQIFKYYCACDVVLLTSLWEGSPNVIKEAMACNRPIVSVDVGDVKEVVGNTTGCFITNREPSDIAQKIIEAFDFSEGTDGRQKIQHLDKSIVAQKIINIYMDTINKAQILT